MRKKKPVVSNTGNFFCFDSNVYNLYNKSVDCSANVEQFNRQCFERSVKICEPLDIEVNKNLEYAGDK